MWKPQKTQGDKNGLPGNLAQADWFDLRDMKKRILGIRGHWEIFKDMNMGTDMYKNNLPVWSSLVQIKNYTKNGSCIELKTVLTAARKWEPRFEICLRTVIKKCKVCTVHTIGMS